MHKLVALAVAAAAVTFGALPARASDNPLRDRVQRWEARALQRALGDDYANLVRPRPEIIGGTVAKAGAWPFQVALVAANEPDNYQAQFCGGTLVSTQYVITAAHCVTEDNGSLTPKNDIEVLFGTQKLNGTGTRVRIAQIKRHPHYNPDTTDFDITVIKLLTPVTGIRVFATILANTDENTLAKPGTVSYVTGWGNIKATGPPSYPVDLRQVQVPIVTHLNCNDANSYKGAITARMICAGLNAGGKDSCQGDSGGPLIVRNKRGLWRVLAGIVSWGDGCAQPNLYGVYSRVATLGIWAKNTIKALGGPTL